MKKFNDFFSSSYGEKIKKISPFILLYIIIVTPATTIIAVKVSNIYLSTINFFIFTFICLGFITYTITQYIIYIKTIK